jgi:hypothetical protein
MAIPKEADWAHQDRQRSSTRPPMSIAWRLVPVDRGHGGPSRAPRLARRSSAEWPDTTRSDSTPRADSRGSQGVRRIARRRMEVAARALREQTEARRTPRVDLQPTRTAPSRSTDPTGQIGTMAPGTVGEGTCPAGRMRAPHPATARRARAAPVLEGRARRPRRVDRARRPTARPGCT